METRKMIVMNLGENRLVDTARGGEGAYTHTHRAIFWN